MQPDMFRTKRGHGVVPNTKLRAVREGMRLSQGEFARKIQEAGRELGEPNECTEKTVRRWEQGGISYPRHAYVRAIEKVTGYSADDLGFDHVPRGGTIFDHSDEPARLSSDARVTEPARLTPVMPSLTGIWESRCTYDSSTRGTRHVDLAHLILVHAGDEITARSIDGSVTDDGIIMMKLIQRGRVITGTWEQTTGPTSYYRGSQFFGAMQLQLEASGARMNGAWVGFGRDFDINTGPWELIRREPGTSRREEYARLPE